MERTHKKYRTDKKSRKYIKHLDISYQKQFPLFKIFSGISVPKEYNNKGNNQPPPSKLTGYISGIV